MPPSETLRLFVALFPPPAVVDRLSEEVGRFRHSLSKDTVRWTPPAQIHLTLNFIGAVAAARVAEFTDALGSGTQRHGSFPVKAQGTGCFPNSRQPRIIWGGLNGDLVAMEAVKVEIDQALAPLGYVPEDRKFHPHLTLGRVNRLTPTERHAVNEWLASLETTEFGAWEASQLQLMQSVLAPTGASYSVVQSFGLKGRI